MTSTWNTCKVFKALNAIQHGTRDELIGFVVSLKTSQLRNLLSKFLVPYLTQSSFNMQEKSTISTKRDSHNLLDSYDIEFGDEIEHKTPENIEIKRNKSISEQLYGHDHVKQYIHTIYFV